MGFCAKAWGTAPRADRAARDFSVSRRLNCWLMELSSGGWKKGSCKKQAHVGGDHAPAFGQAHPGLALAADALGVGTSEFDVGGGEVAAVGRDDGLEQLARRALHGLRGAVARNVF